MLIKRRTFLKTASLAAASLWVPRFLQVFARPQALPVRGKILVVIQLSGGNDGLNTVVPIRNDIYYRERPRIAIKASSALRLTDDAALHPALSGCQRLYDSGDLAILHNVGYPNPDRSHFRSMDIWHSASPAHEYWSTGWLGRYLDAQCQHDACQAPAIEMNDAVGLALKGQYRKGIALRQPAELRTITHSSYFAEYAATSAHIANEDAPIGYLYKAVMVIEQGGGDKHAALGGRPVGAPQAVGRHDLALGALFEGLAQQDGGAPLFPHLPGYSSGAPVKDGGLPHTGRG